MPKLIKDVTVREARSEFHSSSFDFGVRNIHYNITQCVIQLGKATCFLLLYPTIRVVVASGMDT